MDLEDFTSVEIGFQQTMADHFHPAAVDRFLPMLGLLYPSFSSWDLIRELLLGLSDSYVSTSLPVIDERDLPFVKSLEAFRRPDSPSTMHQLPPVSTIGPEYDFLADTCFLVNLTPIQLINLLMLRSIRPTRNVAVVVTMRDEGMSLLEWIAFYQTIGVSDIFVYSNDNRDGSDELLELLAHAGAIKLINSSIAKGTNPQRKAYQHAVHLLQELREFRWVLFLDADEFLVPDGRYDYRLDKFILHVEDSFGQNLPGAVVFPWDWRFGEPQLEKTDGLLFERFPHSVPHSLVRSLTRLNSALGMCEVHIPTLEKEALLVDSSLEPVAVDLVWSAKHKSAAGGVIGHFWGKSFEEYAVKKRRGDLLFLDSLFSRTFEQFFEWTPNPTAATLHPAPPVVLERTLQALEVLNAIPGVKESHERVGARFQELCREIQADCDLGAVFEKLRSSGR